MTGNAFKMRSWKNLEQTFAGQEWNEARRQVDAAQKALDEHLASRRTLSKDGISQLFLEQNLEVKRNEESEARKYYKESLRTSLVWEKVRHAERLMKKSLKDWRHHPIQLTKDEMSLNAIDGSATE